MKYGFKCKKCHLTHVSEDFSMPPLCCGKPAPFFKAEETAAMTEDDFNLQAKTLIDSLTVTNKELIEAMEIIVQTAVALNLGGSSYKERKANLMQYLGMKERKK